MPTSANVALDRAWSTWTHRPAEMVFLPLGVRMTPVAYANSTGRATLFPPGQGVRLGRHDLHAGAVTLDLAHAGTELAWCYVKPDPFRVAGSWRTAKKGEWGLRYWINLCLWADDGTIAMFDPAQGAATLTVGHRSVALATADAPVQVTGHGSVEALAAEYEERGYFYLGSRGSSAPVIVLRFNLEMTPSTRFALAVADRPDLAIERARALLGAEHRIPAPAHSGRNAGALDAVRDVMGWNSVWDEVNARPYTAISRHWTMAKFGGFGVWLDDQMFHALLTGWLDPDVGRENLAVALASGTPQGNLACLVTANDAWVDRTQLPIGAFVVWLMFLRGGSRPLLAMAYGSLARNHAWWWDNRDPGGSGLCSYGTSDVGQGLYKGTSFGARNESSMDNLPIHDEAPYDPETRTLASWDVGLNSLLALDAEMLALMADELGEGEAAERHRARARAVREKIGTELWDDARGIFANRLRSGAFVRSVGPTSFYPLVCAAATPAQTEALLAHLADPATFGGPFVIPSVTRDDPAFADNSYWRGRIWPPLNYFVWQGLRRAGRWNEASALADASATLFRAAWTTRRLCPENYNAETGEPLDQPDTDGFYGWGALMPAMAVGEVIDVSPWDGWCLVNTGEDLVLGPIESPIGPTTLVVSNGELTLFKGETAVLVTDLRGRMSGLRLPGGQLALTLPAPIAAPAFVRVPGLDDRRVRLARIGDADIPVQADRRGATLAIRAESAGTRLLLVWDKR